MSNTTITPTVGATALAGGPVAPANFVAQLGFAGIASLVWALIGANAAGPPTPQQPWNQATFTATGTLGAGGALELQGSSDGQTWVNLGGTGDLTKAGYNNFSSVAGDAQVNVASPGKIIVSISDGSLTEPLIYLRPTIVGGDGTTNVAVTGKLSSVGAV